MRTKAIGSFVRRAFVILAALAGTGPLGAQIVITEIMYNPQGIDGGPEESHPGEFIELFNQTPEAVDISGWYFSKGVEYVFGPDTWIEAHSYLAVCADPNYIRTKYSITNVDGPWTAGTALANGGETIALAESSGKEVTEVRYNDRGKWPGAADGTGHSLEIEWPFLEVDDPDHWAASANPGGSPGKVNPTRVVPKVIFNEGLILTSGERFVELYNPGTTDVSILDHYITNNPEDLAKVKLGAKTVPAKGRLAIGESELGADFLVPDAPPPDGRTFVALVSTDGKKVIDAYNFEPKVVEKSEARFPDGDEDWAPAAEPTRGNPNEVNVETNIVLNEIMYHPIGDDETLEYIELYNRGTSAVSLASCRLDQGFNYDFPAGTVIPGGEYLVVARNPERIRQVYGLPVGKVLGPAQDPESLAAFGALRNGGERITLLDGSGNVMDTVRFYDSGEWPRWADGLGSSLELIDPFSDNSRACAWDASDDSAKAQTKTFSYTSKHAPSSGESELHLVLMNRGIAIVDDIAVRSTTGSIVEDPPLVNWGATWRYKKGTEEASNPVEAWRGTGFSDAGWSSGATPIGYDERNPGGIATTLSDMKSGYIMFFARKTFTLTAQQIADIEKLYLDIKIDDGHIAYLNGKLLENFNVSAPDYQAKANNAENLTRNIDITSSKSSLVVGTNVLAIQVHNVNIGSSGDCFFDARLYPAHVQSGAGGPNIVPNGTFDANDGNWIIEGNHIESGRTTVNPITGAGSLKLIASGRGDNKVNRIECETSPAMNTTDTYEVSFKARWVVGSRTILTHDFQNLDTSLAASHQLDIPPDLGTPGAVNSCTARQVQVNGDDNLGPTISNVSHAPSVPQGNEAVTVRARISDPDGVQSAKVLYHLNTPGAGQAVEPEPVGIFYDHRDVGAPCGIGGTTSSSATQYAVTGGGLDIWTGGDQFQFAYTYATGNFTMTARLAAKAWASGSRWGKVGIMARQSLSSTARYAMVQDHGEDLQDSSRFAGRPTDGGSDNFEIGVGAAGAHPTWLRLVREGNIFRGYGSSNGTTWTLMEQMDWGVGAPATVLLGLAVCAHSDASGGCATTTITFDNVTIQGDYGDPPDPGDGTCVDQACEVNMTDPDGDGIYTATLPGRALGQKVLFWIRATDQAGRTERYPPDVTKRTHPLLLDPTTTDPAAQRYLIYRHDTRGSTSLTRPHKYRFVMHDLDEAYLSQRRVLSNDPIEGSFIFGTGDLYYNTRIRFSGSPWARSAWGSFRLRFPTDNRLHGSVSQINLEQDQWGPTGGKGRTSHYFFRHLSRPESPVAYDIFRRITFSVNARAIGLRDHVHAPNGDTLEKFWPDVDGGDFFEMDDRFELNDGGARINSRDGRLLYPPYNGNPEDKEEYRWYFNLRQDEDGDSFGNLIDLAKVMDPGDTTDAQFDGLIDQFINVQSFLRVFAVRLNSSDWDSWGADRGKNYYLYRPPVDARWYLIPWDMELTYEDVNRYIHPTGSSGSFGFSFGEVNRLLNRPRIRRIYYGILKELVDGMFWSERLAPFAMFLQEAGLTDVAQVQPGGYVDQRRTRIQTWIAPVTAPTVTLKITAPNSGNNTSVTTSTVNLAGEAPVDAFKVTVTNETNGEVRAAVFSNSSMVQWSVSGVPLAPGGNDLVVVGTNTLDEIVGSDTIVVTYTGNWVAPSISSIAPASAPPGDVITITGADFHTGLKVFFGSTAATQVDFDEAGDPTHIRVTVPQLNPGNYQVKVRNLDNKESGTRTFTVTAPLQPFIRGDANLDGNLDISDAVKMLFHLYAGQSVTCRDALDSNQDGALNIADVNYILNYLYKSGPAPTEPFPDPGYDPEVPADSLDCLQGLP